MVTYTNLIYAYNIKEGYYYSGFYNYIGTDCVSNSVRLIDVSSSKKKVVEVCKDGVWGSITSSRWSNRAARVVCRQLGLPWQSKF